jgi:hypothetical protein
MATADEKEYAKDMLMIILKAIQEVMRGGGEQTLHFEDAEINIKKKASTRERSGESK